MLCGLRIEKIIRRLYLVFLCGCLHTEAFNQPVSGIKIIVRQYSGDYEIADASSHQSFKDTNISTGYLFAFTSEKNRNRQMDFSPSSIGMKSKMVVFDPAAQKVTILNADDHFKAELPDELYRYYILAPITNSGIAFFGDTSKIVSSGKQRIVSIKI